MTSKDMGVWQTMCWADMAEQWREHLRYFLNQVSSRAPVELALALGAEDPEYKRIAAAWDTLDLQGRQEASHALDELARKTAYLTRPYCQRCGKCCHNSGPTLYREDLELLRSGRLSPHVLVTYRAGARVYSHFHGGEIALEHEVVAIAPDARGGCPYLAAHPTACRMHRDTPLQCQAQKCWDTAASEALQARPGLTRLEIIPRGHAARALVQLFEAGGDEAELRERAKKEAGEYALALDFLFGKA